MKNFPNMNKLFLIVCTLFLSACDTNKNEQQYEPVIIQLPRQVDKLNYTVKDGDTVGSIAQAHNMTRVDLIDLNRLTPPYELYAGQKLIVNSTSDSQVHTSNVEHDEDQNKMNKFTDSLNQPHKIEIVQKGGLEISGNTRDVNNKENQKSKEEELDVPDDSDFQEEAINSKITNSTIDTESVSDKKPMYIWPVAQGKQKIIQQFSPNSEYVLIESSGGTPVKSACSGIVKFAGKPPNEENNVYGNMVLIMQNNPNRLFMYAKLQDIKVHSGNKVNIGDTLGNVANSNNPYLYFSVMDINKQKKRTPIDPTKIIQ